MSSGVMTFATDESYAKMAYLAALSYRIQEKVHGFAVGVPTYLLPLLPAKYQEVMTIVDAGELPAQRFGLERKAWQLSPFSSVTIKMDADVLFPPTWKYDFDTLESSLKTVNFLLGEPVTHQGAPVTWLSPYRQAFWKNGLPDVYSTSFAFSNSISCVYFYKDVGYLLDFWGSDSIEWFYPEDWPKEPQTDECYAIALLRSGSTYTHTKLLNFVHMKTGTMFEPNMGVDPGTPWTAVLPFVVTDECNLYVDNQAQAFPCHYVQKEICTDELLRKYEKRLGI